MVAIASITRLRPTVDSTLEIGDSPSPRYFTSILTEHPQHHGCKDGPGLINHLRRVDPTAAIVAPDYNGVTLVGREVQLAALRAHRLLHRDIRQLRVFHVRWLEVHKAAVSHHAQDSDQTFFVPA